jgi:hypothetical protein
MHQFKYTLSDNDYFEFNKHHLFNAPANKGGLVAARLMVPAIFVVFLLLSLVFIGFDVSLFIGQVVGYTIISVAWGFLVKPFYVFTLKKNIKTMKKHGKLPYVQDILICFDEDSVIETTPETETKMKYTKIERIAESNLAIYVYTSAAQAIILPFSVFESEKQRDDFRDFIHCKWDEAKATNPRNEEPVLTT